MTLDSDDQRVLRSARAALRFHVLNCTLLLMLAVFSIAFAFWLIQTTPRDALTSTTFKYTLAFVVGIGGGWLGIFWRTLDKRHHELLLRLAEQVESEEPAPAPQVAHR